MLFYFVPFSSPNVILLINSIIQLFDHKFEHQQQYKMMKLLNTILLLSAFTCHVTAQNNCACYPLQYTFTLDLNDLTKACDYTYQDGEITDNNGQGPNPIPPGIANLDLPPSGVGNPAAFEYVGCSTLPDITVTEVALVEIEEIGPDDNRLKFYEYGGLGEPGLVHGTTINYDSITFTEPTAIVKTLKVYLGLKGTDDLNQPTNQDFEFEVRYSNLCNVNPYTENDFAGYLNFVSFQRAPCSLFLSFFN